MQANSRCNIFFLFNLITTIITVAIKDRILKI